MYKKISAFAGGTLLTFTGCLFTEQSTSPGPENFEPVQYGEFTKCGEFELIQDGKKTTQNEMYRFSVMNQEIDEEPDWAEYWAAPKVADCQSARQYTQKRNEYFGIDSKTYDVVSSENGALLKPATQVAIYGGSASKVTAVGQITTNDHIATATFIEKRAFLTTAATIVNSSNPWVQPNPQSGVLDKLTIYDNGKNNDWYGVKYKAWVHHHYAGFGDWSDDIAIVKVDKYTGYNLDKDIVGFNQIQNSYSDNEVMAIITTDWSDNDIKKVFDRWNFNVQIRGWGATCNTCGASDKLKYFDTYIHSTETGTFKTVHGDLHTKATPVGSKFVDSKTCKGDSGGPVSLKKESFGLDELVAVGMTVGHQGENRCQPDRGYTWHTSLYKKASWIKDIMDNNITDDCYYESSKGLRFLKCK